MAKRIVARRERGHIRRLGNSYQVLVYAGIDPLTGKELRLTASTTDEAEAHRILKRFRAQVDEQSHARTKATFRAAMQAWLRVHEIEETTRQGYESYARLYLYPAFGDEPVGRIPRGFWKSSTRNCADAVIAATAGRRWSTGSTAHTSAARCDIAGRLVARPRVATRSMTAPRPAAP